MASFGATRAMIEAKCARISRQWLLFAGLLVVSLVVTSIFSKQVDDSFEKTATVQTVHRTKAPSETDSPVKRPKDHRVSENDMQKGKENQVQIAWIMSFGGSVSVD